MNTTKLLLVGLLVLSIAFAGCVSNNTSVSSDTGTKVSGDTVSNDIPQGDMDSLDSDLSDLTEMDDSFDDTVTGDSGVDDNTFT